MLPQPTSACSREHLWFVLNVARLPFPFLSRTKFVHGSVAEN
jgi:hypothetical protein